MQVDENKWLLFDVTMGAYCRAEVCELVQTFSLASVYIMTTGRQLTKNIQGLWFRNSGRI